MFTAPSQIIKTWHKISNHVGYTERTNEADRSTRTLLIEPYFFSRDLISILFFFILQELYKALP